MNHNYFIIMDYTFFSNMHKIFKIWLIALFFLTLIAVIIVDKASPVFGFLVLPSLVIIGIVIILGYYLERKRK